MALQVWRPKVAPSCQENKDELQFDVSPQKSMLPKLKTLTNFRSADKLFLNNGTRALPRNLDAGLSGLLVLRIRSAIRFSKRLTEHLTA